ncbi:MAG: hypothetical protein AB4060_16310 [Crocosphaera sp.]
MSLLNNVTGLTLSLLSSVFTAGEKVITEDKTRTVAAAVFLMKDMGIYLFCGWLFRDSVQF